MTTTTTTDPLNGLLYIRNSAFTTRWNFQDAVGSSINSPAGIGNAATVSYSFLNAFPSYYVNPTGFAAFSASQQQTVRDVLAAISNVINVTFNEVSIGGMMSFAMSTQSQGLTGFAYAPNFSYSYTNANIITSVSLQENAGDVWFNSSVAWTSSDFALGGSAYGGLIHEIGHTLGLKHPFEDSSGNGYVLDSSLDSSKYTVMSYTNHPYDLYRTVIETSPNNYSMQYTHILPETFMPLDISALQYLYGANTSFHSGNDTYSFDTARPFIQTIWDGGGNDTISVTNFTLGCVIDLKEGNYSSIHIPSDAMPAGTTETNTGIYDGTDNLAIAYGTVIENAIGGSGNDTLIGNSVANNLSGGNGDDTLKGGTGNDTLNGDLGTDTAIYDGSWSTYTVTGNATSATITALTGTDGTDSLSSIENLRFNGVTVATIIAVNDAPVGVADNNASDAVVEAGIGVAGDSTALGNVLSNDTDADSGLGLGETKTVKTVNGQLANVGNTVSGVYGSLVLLANGSYTYTLNNANAATNALNTGQVVTDNFTYTVVDAHGASSASTTLSINISGSNDIVNLVPTLTSFASTVASGNEDNPITVTFANLQSQGNEADADGTVTAFIIKSVSTGTLKIGVDSTTATAWSAVNNSVDVSHTAYWLPALNGNGILNAFTVVAKDNSGLESISAIQATVTIASVNDAPSGTNKSITFNQNNTYIFTVADFGFNDVDANSLLAVKISSLPLVGSLTLNNVAVSSHASINIADINNGKLAFTPANNANGTNYASFNFQVQDNGGTANGGVDLDATVNTLSFNVANYLIGTPDADVLDGGAGDDLLDRGVLAPNSPSVTDYLNGNDGNDTFVTRSFFGVGIYDGGEGSDWLDFSQTDTYTAGRRSTEGAGVKVDLLNNTAYTYYQAATLYTWTDFNGQITTTNIENVRGTTQIDHITGNVNANILDGGDGNDVMLGKGGNDILTGGAGNDNLNGGGASDVINGGVGDDSLDGGVSDVKNTGVIDTLNGDAGNDIFIARGFYGAGIYTGGDGVDVLDFSQADSYTAGRRIAEGAGVNVDLATDTAFTYYIKATGYIWTNPNGQISVASIENLIGSIKADVLSGDINANRLEGGTGADVISGRAGDDILIGGLGNDTLTGGLGIDTADYSSSTDAISVNLSITTAQVVGVLTGTDTLIGIENLIGGSLGDTLTGDIAANTIRGGTGGDTIRGDSGDDIIYGDGGADLIIGGAGNDSLTGGAGMDTFRLNSLSFVDTITDFVVADDTLQLASSVFTSLTILGVLNSANFIIATTATDTNDYIIYNNTTGALLYDADGNGANIAVQIAQLGINLSLSNADFVVI